jgi:hypothetical protein
MFFSVCLSGTDNSNHITPLGERYDKKPMSDRVANDDFSEFLFRVLFIIEDECKRISEYGGGFHESDTMLPRVPGRFLCIPLELYIHTMHLTAPLGFWQISSQMSINLPGLFSSLHKATKSTGLTR